MSKLDYKKDLKNFYFPPTGKFSQVDVPAMNFLMIDGHGDPNTNPQFQENTEALYNIAYSIKFALKPGGAEYVIPPLEGLWWAEDMSLFGLARKDQWDWTLMIIQPELVTSDIVEAIRREVLRKKKLAVVEQVRFERYHEGLAVQIMYLGAYADEGPTIAQMHVYINECGYTFNGKHHEIYLGDPRRTPPEKLKTVIRQPVRKVLLLVDPSDD